MMEFIGFLICQWERFIQWCFQPKIILIQILFQKSGCKSLDMMNKFNSKMWNMKIYWKIHRIWLNKLQQAWKRRLWDIIGDLNININIWFDAYRSFKVLMIQLLKSFKGWLLILFVIIRFEYCDDFAILISQ